MDRSKRPRRTTFKRSDVAFLLPLLQLHAFRYPLHDPADCAGLNESEVHWLAPLRHALIFAGLIARRSGFRITSRGRELKRPERVGELYARLFFTVFRHLNLRLLDFDHHEGLQATVAYTLYRLPAHAQDWATSVSLADDVWLPGAKDPPCEWEIEFQLDERHHALEQQVLDPLSHFGLLERREHWSLEKPPRLGLHEYRLTPLFQRFVHIEIAPSM